MACWGQLEFNEAMSPVMQDFIFFHDHVMLILIFIISFVGFMMASSLTNKYTDVFLLENQSLEVIWTLLPVFVLLYIGAPSLYILYSMDYDYLNLSQEDFHSIKVTGHQWYWSYSNTADTLTGSKEINFDSYMLPQAEIMPGEIRLLDVDNRLLIPLQTMIKIFVTSADVLHSWAVPSLGLKVDACPGRLNQMISFINHPGVFYGQCSEICGANHSFMPIVLEVRPMEEFLTVSQLQF